MRSEAACFGGRWVRVRIDRQEEAGRAGNPARPAFSCQGIHFCSKTRELQFGDVSLREFLRRVQRRKVRLVRDASDLRREAFGRLGEGRQKNKGARQEFLRGIAPRTI